MYFFINISSGFSAEAVAKWVHDRADVQVSLRIYIHMLVSI
jgi:hypothetical protein